MFSIIISMKHNHLEDVDENIIFGINAWKEEWRLSASGYQPEANFTHNKLYHFPLSTRNIANVWKAA